MSLDSKVIMSEEVSNKDRKFGSNLSYFPAKVVLIDGTENEALFTVDQLNEAMERASRNPEDMPKEHSSFFSWLFN